MLDSCVGDVVKPVLWIFLRDRCRSRRTLSGVSAGNASQSGSRLRIAATASDSVSPENASRPVNISYRTHPNAQISVRLSVGLPRACSGLMYAAVPRMVPSSVPPKLMVGDRERS